jgi:hypothetical protein
MPAVFSPACLGLMRKLSAPQYADIAWKAKLIRATFAPTLQTKCCSTKLIIIGTADDKPKQEKINFVDRVFIFQLRAQIFAPDY